MQRAAQRARHRRHYAGENSPLRPCRAVQGQHPLKLKRILVCLQRGLCGDAGEKGQRLPLVPAQHDVCIACIHT